MQLGMISGAGVSTSGVTIPALILYAPLSSTSVFAGGGGPDDFVLRGGAIVLEVVVVEVVVVEVEVWWG